MVKRPLWPSVTPPQTPHFRHFPAAFFILILLGFYTFLLSKTPR